jgi:LCP family protein required for cell wall assembly
LGKHLAASDPPKRSVWRAFVLALGIAVIALAGAVYAVSLAKHENFLTALTQAVAPDPRQVFGKDRILVLLMGKDYDYDPHDYETSKTSRSDVIQVYSLDFVNHRVNELSVPRDTDVTYPNGTEAKINEALSEGGISEAQTVIGNFLGVPGFDRYVVLRINASKSVVDAIGGIDVLVKEQMDYDDSWGHLHIHFKPGLHHMNGEQAVSYARFRHDACGDPCRITRQQQVLRIVINKLKNNKLNDLAHAGSLISAFRRNVDTNMSSSEMLSVAAAFFNLDPKSMKTAQVPYVDTRDTAAGNVLIPDDVAKKKLVATLLLPPPAGLPRAQQLANISPASVRVEVRNGTGMPGEARKVANALQTKGFVIAQVGNANGSYTASEIHDHTTLMLAGAKVRSALPSAFRSVPILTDAAGQPPTSDVTIIVGRDVLTASAPQASLK